MSVEARLAALEAQNAEMYKAMVALNDAIQQNAVFAGSINDLVVTTVKDVSFITLFTFWLAHALERVEQVVPIGTTDLILNSVEENIDISEATFIGTFETLRDTE